jgi:hypothetical protein
MSPYLPLIYALSTQPSHGRIVVSLDRKCLGAYAATSASCPEAFPIKANDFAGATEDTFQH